MPRFTVPARLLATRNRGPFMPLLLSLLLIVAIVALLRMLANTERRPRSEHAYRPRGRWRPADAARGADSADAGTHWVATRAELEGLRDAFSSAALDLSRPLVRCGDCQAHYQADSLVALRREHGGRCALCGGSDLRPVHLA
jgi:hypothetical protein